MHRRPGAGPTGIARSWLRPASRRWPGEEWQLLLKTHPDRFTELEAHLVAHHPWKNPEVFAVAAVAGAEAYLGWVAATTSPLPAAE
ncbi:divalent cation tolerance protein CutA [Streptomyces sp. NPDC058086]|uniref:divalent cation tolerance protein CutA n=1 Tax=Streptomyces sp. NPDC058086 TaxID=3346334 RepID=UPI0036E0DF3B